MSLQHFCRGTLRVAKNYTKGYSDTQAKVRDATSNDPWGPSGTQMHEIAQLSYNQSDFVEIMDILDRRLNDKGKCWRHVFKSLTVLDYLLHAGPENVVRYYRDNLYVIKTLKEFQHVDEDGKDCGANVRQKAKDISNLLGDVGRLREERRNRARTTREPLGVEERAIRLSEEGEAKRDKAVEDSNVAALCDDQSHLPSSANTHELTRSRDDADALIWQRYHCNALYTQGRINDAARLLLEMLGSTSNTAKTHKVIAGWHPDSQMQQKLSGDMSHDEQAHWQWMLGFRQRCSHRLAKLGDTAMESHRYHEAVEQFSTILSLDPANRVEILIKRSKARLFASSWEDALCDADEVIKSDPSSHLGYEQKHAALHVGKQYTEAVDAFHAMLAVLKKSPDLRTQYIDVTPIIQEDLKKTLSDLPRVLIDTASGHLYDKEQQIAAFKKFPVYDELRSSMTTRLSLDRRRIEREVQEFYRYVMLSHRWEEHGEPCYQTVQSTPVYELQVSSPNSKLQRFCEIARDFGFRWAWSDTCCIDKKDIVVLHESLVAMFTWYRGSALTFVHLQDVSSQKPGALQQSVWNERGWTYQEYVAAETVRFYSRDWKPYLGLDVFNHKESPTIMAEMEKVSQVSVKELATLQPGLNRVREKLFLAARRQTTLAEDAAYSLLGIFSATIPIRYGEGKCVAVGRLLEQVLTGSGDVTILAWTGPAGDYNSCLPPDLTAYKQLVPPHIPCLDIKETTQIATTLESSLSESDLTSVVPLYHRFNELPPPSLNSSRLQLSGLAFPVTGLTGTQSVYHGTATALGNVEIKTADDLSKMKRLLLFHPWICALLDQDFSDDDDDAVWVDDTTRALRLVARLRQPFGALLLAQVSRAQYRRVATDSLIMVQVREDILLSYFDKSITTVIIQ